MCRQSLLQQQQQQRVVASSIKKLIKHLSDARQKMNQQLFSGLKSCEAVGSILPNATREETGRKYLTFCTIRKLLMFKVLKLNGRTRSLEANYKQMSWGHPRPFRFRAARTTPACFTGAGSLWFLIAIYRLLLCEQLGCDGAGISCRTGFK